MSAWLNHDLILMHRDFCRRVTPAGGVALSKQALSFLVPRVRNELGNLLGRVADAAQHSD